MFNFTKPNLTTTMPESVEQAQDDGLSIGFDAETFGTHRMPGNHSGLDASMVLFIVLAVNKAYSEIIDHNTF